MTEWNAEAIGVGIRDGRAWLTTEEAAEHLAVSKRTLARLRRSGDGPKFARRGQIIRYRAADLDAWMEGCSVPPVSSVPRREGCGRCG